ncbi:uncharacterized protein LOC129095517 [Anoplopoma fimbria]|uniref:uncharacterized protein LOC129095517 n=1 Tax=Anoplopoma fimbria TaxID=229290 RepID=UPI0023EC72C2|nr:uncharacterized protein LOC129095517 [Anoplopoma fimbria]
MIISVHFTLLFFWVAQDFVSCVNRTFPIHVLAVALGDSLTLNCTFNCSTGFVRGCWSEASDNSGCLGTYTKSSLCITSLHLSNVSTEDIKNYTCYTLATDQPQLPQKTERLVILQLQAQTSVPNWTTIPKTGIKSSLPAKPKDSGEGEFTGIKVLATVTVAVATVLAALAVYLCLSWNRRSRNDKGETVVSRSGSPLPRHAAPSPVKGSQSTQSERVRIPTPDNESDTEVPYADIMITVRGISTPELTQVGYLAPGDQKEWWGDESRSHLKASRSADRLHVPQPREISRKMSTNSEYAVITYA